MGAPVYSESVSLNDKTQFESNLLSEITQKIAVMPTTPTVDNKAFFSSLTGLIKMASEYGVDTSSVAGIASYNVLEPDLAEVDNVSIDSVNDVVTMDIAFTVPTKLEYITKANFQLSCDRQSYNDYTIVPVIANNKATGAVITFKNSISSKDYYQLLVKFGVYCNYSGNYTIQKPITISNQALKNVQGTKIDSIKAITDGTLKVTADITNNTYTDTKAVKLVTAVYNGKALYQVQVSDVNLPYKTAYPVSTTFTIPTDGSVTTDWSASIFAWESINFITPLLKKTDFQKTYGLDVLNDPTKELKVALIGGSQTEGRMYSTPLVSKLNQQRVANGGSAVEINAGVGGSGSDYGVYRLQEDVLSKSPDVVIVEFTLNDTGNDSTIIKTSIEGIIRQCQNALHQPVVMFMHVASQNANINNTINFYEPVLSYYGITPMNFKQYADSLVTAGTYQWSDLTNSDGVHLSTLGGQIGADFMYDLMTGDTTKATYCKNLTIKETPYSNAILYGTPKSVSSFSGIYDSNWADAEPGNQVTEGYQNPVTQSAFKHFMVTNVTGASMTFKFKGTKIAITGLRGMNGRSATYNIDGITSGTIQNYIGGYNWYKGVLLTKYGLSEGEHTITITVNDNTGMGETFGIGDFWVDE